MPSGRQVIQQRAFASLYRAGRWLYDPLTESVFDGEWDRWRRSIIPFVDSGPVLDLGCGTGALLRAFNESGWQAVGLERESNMLAAAGKRGQTRGALVSGDAATLPFKSGVFGACVSTFPAPFILQTPTLTEIYRVLRVGGTFAVVFGGQLDVDSPRRQIVSILLSIFYGRESHESSDDGRKPMHAGLPGAWATVRTERGAARVWLATKIAEPHSSGTG